MRADVRIAALGAGALALLAPLAAPAATQKVKTVAVRDAADDAATGGVELTRVSLGIADDGRLRAAITAAKAIDPKALLARSGPPGSVCLRLWTLTKPVGIPPDYLVCVTANKDGKLRATISAEQVDAQPRRVGPAQLTRSGSRTLVLKFGRSTVGSPKSRISFAAEATKTGCIRVSCVDTAPDAPKTGTLRLTTS
jgi:hypothetical protein